MRMLELSVECGGQCYNVVGGVVERRVQRGALAVGGGRGAAGARAQQVAAPLAVAAGGPRPLALLRCRPGARGLRPPITSDADVRLCRRSDLFSDWSVDVAMTAGPDPARNTVVETRTFFRRVRSSPLYCHLLFHLLALSTLILFHASSADLVLIYLI